MKLRNYQEDALQAIEHYLEDGVDKQLLVLPTGAGKTVTAAHLPQRVPGRLLFLAHREELLNQGAETFATVNPDLKIQVEQAEIYADIDADVVFASVQTLGRSGSDRIKRFPRDHFSTIIVDECHRASPENSTYVNILDYFESDLRVGMTATPQRGDGVSLHGIFDEIVFFRTITEMIRDGYLVDLKAYRISTDIDISKVSSRAGDYAIGELSNAINTQQRNDLAVQSYEDFAPGKKMLVFCADVQHAHDMAAAFNKHGINAAALDGTSEKELRKETVHRFQHGDLQVLTNVGLFVEGTDIPAIQAVMLARPTRSPVVMSQAIGRGLRLYDDKEYCTVIDLADSAGRVKPIGLPTLMGLPPDFDSQGGKLTEIAEEFAELEEKAPAEAARARSVDDIKAAWERIDLFTPPPINETIKEFSQFVWMETSADTYMLNLAEGERLTIRGDTLGRWHVTLRHKNQKDYKLGVVASMEEAFSRSDNWIRNKRGDQTKLIDSEAVWRNDPPTEKQIKYLKQNKIPIAADMTKGQASQILSKIFAEQPKPKRSAAQEYIIRKKKEEKRGF